MPHSPQRKQASKRYSDGWRAVNELVRSDGSWSGRERNTCYRNLGEGAFADVSYVTGLDFDGDGRSFVSFDYDHDGDLDLLIKSRTAPQIRIVRNDSTNLNRSFQVILRGAAGNRDAVGARVTLKTNQRRMLREVTAGSSYLSQHSRRPHFGLLPDEVIQAVEVRWPNGRLQAFTDIPSGRFIELMENRPTAQPLHPSPPGPGQTQQEKPLITSPGTWLVEKVPAPPFSLPDLNGAQQDLFNHRGKRVLLTFWATWCPPCRKEMAQLQSIASRASAQNIQILAVSVDEPGQQEKVRQFALDLKLSYPILHAEERTVSVYSMLNRYLFDRRRDLGIPTTFLLDEEGQIVKVWVGPAPAESMLADARIMQGSPIPFAGSRFTPTPGRNYIDMGAALAERGFHTEAKAIFEAAIGSGQRDPLLLSNLGTLLLEAGDYAAAEKLLSASVRDKPDHVDARINLSILALRRGNPGKALEELEPALAAYPDDAALLALAGTAHFQSGNTQDAEKLFRQALELDPDSGEHHYNLASVLAQTGRHQEAVLAYESAQKAGYSSPDLFSNLGVLYMGAGDKAKAKAAFQQAFTLDPQDYSANLNLAQYHSVAGAYEESLRGIERAQRIDPARPEAYLLQADVLASKGDRDAARRILTTLIAEHPDFLPAAEALKKLP